MKIGFIGLGNMAQAMIGGILNRKLAAPDEIFGSAKTAETERRVGEVRDLHDRGQPGNGPESRSFVPGGQASVF